MVIHFKRLLNSSNKFICSCGKCKLLYRDIKCLSADEYNTPDSRDMRRAGTFIYTDSPNEFVLLVQSYKGKWGPPKGGFEHGETSIQCALRETFEETGWDVNKSMDKVCHSLNNKWDMYKVKMPFTVKPVPMCNEISGAGWVSIQCIHKNKHLINHPAKLSLREFKGINL